MARKNGYDLPEKLPESLMPKLIDLDDSAGAQACLSLPLSAAPFIHFLISHLIRPRVTALLCKTRMLEVVN